MVELLVVMIVIALLGGVVVPNVNQWINSRKVAEQRKSLAMELSALVPKAYFSQTPIVINVAEDLNIKLDGSLTVIEPIKIMSNGYCKGGKVELKQDNAVYDLIVNEPLCDVYLRPSKRDY